jgi:antitoxin (DNA-binding transcriptional repressor) of toxin-antitoxin stability system
MPTSIDIRDLPHRLDEILARMTSEGGEVILTEGETPRARIIPIPQPRIPGLHPGAIQTHPDFDAPLRSLKAGLYEPFPCGSEAHDDPADLKPPVPGSPVR